MKKQHIFLIFAITYVGMFCYIGFYAYPSADDFNLANMIRLHGFWRAQWEWYISWPISPIHQSLVSIPAALNFTGYRLLSLITCFINLCALYSIVRKEMEYAGVGAREKLALVFSAALLLQAAWLAVVPGLNENFYWLDGIGYTWNCTFFLFAVALLIPILRKTMSKQGKFDASKAVACIISLFVASAYLVQFSAFLCVLFFVAFFASFILKKKTATISFLALTLVAFIGFLVLYFSPGIPNRMGNALPMSLKLFQTLGVAAVFGGITALKFFTKPIIYVFLLFLPGIAENVAPFDQKITPRLRGWHIFTFVTMIAPFQQAIAGWATGIGLPARAEGLAIWIMGATWVFLWIFGYRNEPLFGRIRSLCIYRWREVLLVLCLLLSGNFISLLRDLPLAPLYAAEMRAREVSIARQKNEGKTDVVVPSFTVKPKLLFFSDIRPSPNDWKNQSVAEYWGVESISALPGSMLDDERAIFDFREGKLSGMKAMAEAGDPEVQFMLGEIYDTTFAPHNGVPKDNAEASKWYHMAAMQKHAHASRRLTRLYALGMGVPKNYLYALGWLLRSQF